MDENRLLAEDGYQCFLLDPETAECFEALYMGDYGELAKKTALGAIATSRFGPEPCGLMVFHTEGRTLQIEWVQVIDVEGDGVRIARRLINALLMAAWKTGISEITTLVSDSQDWLQRAYRDYGFTFDDAGYGEIRVHLSDLKVEPAQSSLFVSLHDLLPSELAAFGRELKERGSFCPVSLPIQKKDYLRESCACVHEGKIHSLLLLQEGGEDNPNRITIPWLYSDAKGKSVLTQLYSHAAYQLMDSRTDNPELVFGLVEPVLKRTVEKFFSRVTYIPMRFGYALLS